jgi:hypothetical protein
MLWQNKEKIMGISDFLQGKNNHINDQNFQIINQIKELANKGVGIKALELSEKLIETDKFTKEKIDFFKTTCTKGAITELLGLAPQFMESRDFDKCFKLGMEVFKYLVGSEENVYKLPKGTMEKYFNKLANMENRQMERSQYKNFLEEIRQKYLYEEHLNDEEGGLEMLNHCIFFMSLKHLFSNENV